MRWHQEKSHDMHNFSEEVGNTFLARLDEETRLRWQPHLRKMELQRGQALSHAGCSPEHVYLPTRSVVALYAITDDGACSELALVGHEGLVGLCSAMGSAAIFNNAMVVVGGPSWRMSAAWFRHEVMNDPLIMQSMLRYSQALFTQVAQTAVCNRHHSIDHALCRWLLMSLDRVRCAPLQLTQALIARLMGVRREGVTEAAVRLQRLGLIQYTRGCITVTDRAGLERAACECYGRVRAEHQRLLGWPMGELGHEAA
jgi:CRP-like cAMP-binding protein